MAGIRNEGSDSAAASTNIGGTPGRLHAPPTVANIPDANLAAALRTALGLTEGAAIPISTLRTLTHLQADGAGISDLINWQPDLGPVTFELGTYFKASSADGGNQRFFRLTP